MKIDRTAPIGVETEVGAGHLPEEPEDPGPSGSAPLAPVEQPDEEPESSSSIFSSWWFWTAAGVLVAGGVGLTLFLTLGGGEATPPGEVIFKF
jgi:hypothetical protein